MRVGFTGTRHGMSGIQKDQLAKVLRLMPGGFVFHHGAAQGADTQAAEIAGGYTPTVVAHPAEPGKELARNRVIVANSDILIAAPRTDKEELRSGTWATVRYARQAGIPVVMLSR